MNFMAWELHLKEGEREEINLGSEEAQHFHCVEESVPRRRRLGESEPRGRKKARDGGCQWRPQECCFKRRNGNL